MTQDNVATWLELAVAPVWALKKARVGAHPVLDQDADEPWYALTVNGRLLFAGGGRLTLLRGKAAVERFLFLIGLHSVEFSESITLPCETEQQLFKLEIEADRSSLNFGQLKLDEHVQVSLAA